MARRKISQTALAAHLGMTQSAVSRRLTGEVPFDVVELEAAAALLGVSAAQLLLDGAA